MLTYSDVIISGNELYITFNTTYILKKKIQRIKDGIKQLLYSIHTFIINIAERTESNLISHITEVL